MAQKWHKIREEMANSINEDTPIDELYAGMAIQRLIELGLYESKPVDDGNEFISRL